MKRWSKRVAWGVPLALAVTLSTTALPVQQPPGVPGNATQGAELFHSKGCVRCHSFDGSGGNRAPDLARRSERAYTPALLASVMWNHGPAMWSAMAEVGQRIPALDPAEAADLFAYFYSRLYFSIPGDAARGKAVFEQKNCVHCHDVTETPGSVKPGPPISRWSTVKDPLAWSESMWNHSGAMFQEMQKAGLQWPELTTRNMVDLIVYLRNLPAAREVNPAFQPGNSTAGRAIFELRCAGCHTFGSPVRGKVDLLSRPAPRTLTGYATFMWNHAPRMKVASAAAGKPFPTLREGEMSHLAAYLFAQRYFYEQGDVRQGERVYRQKNCIVCHEQRRAEIGAPDLTQLVGGFSPITLTSSLWRHGPPMLEAMQRQNLPWPTFNGSDMSDLIEYLNSRRR